MDQIEVAALSFVLRPLDDSMLSGEFFTWRVDNSCVCERYFRNPLVFSQSSIKMGWGRCMKRTSSETDRVGLLSSPPVSVQTTSSAVNRQVFNTNGYRPTIVYKMGGAKSGEHTRLTSQEAVGATGPMADPQV